MKIILQKTKLLSALSLATNVVNKRNVSEILGYVLLDGMMGELRINATDLDMEVETRLAADVAQIGVVTTDALRFRDIVQSCGSEITLEHGLSDDPRLMIVSGRSRFRVPTLPVSDFPKIPDEDWAATYIIHAVDLKEMLESVAYAVSKDVQGQYFLTGVRLEPENGSLVAIATNRHRIAKYSVEAPSGSLQAPGVTIPPKMVSQIVSACANHVGEVAVSVSESRVRFAIGPTKLSSKVIEADYLDVSRAIPKETPLTASANRDALMLAIKRAQLTGDPGKDGEGVKLIFSEGLLTVSGRSQVSDGLDEMEVEYRGPDYTVGVTARYVLEALNAIHGHAVQLGFGDGIPALKITSEEDPNALMTVGLRVVP